MATDIIEVSAMDTSPDASILSSAIERDFVPVPQAGVIGTDFDGELLLVDPEAGAMHVLDAIGALVWSLFDGEASLAELSDELAEAFGAPLETVERDVLALAQSLGGVGLLAGVEPDVPEQSWTPPALPTGLPQGDELPPFRLRGSDGATVDLADFRGQRTLLVNWSPTCGYCRKIMPDLVETAERSGDDAVRIVLVAAGDVQANMDLLAEGGLAATLMLRDGAENSFEDPFPGMGTPVAYLLDRDGRVADAMAYGAQLVPVLARRAVGLPEQEQAPAAPHDHAHDAAAEDSDGAPRAKYLSMPASANVCQPSASKQAPRDWAATGTYRIEDLHVGVRADSPETDGLLGRVFASLRTDNGEQAPANYSVVLPGAGRELNLLLFGNTTLVRSRSPRRVVRALAANLSGLVDRPEESGVIRVRAMPVVKDGRALLLPDIIRSWLEKLQPRLAKLGWALSDAPDTGVDVATGDVIVPEPSIEMDPDALAEVPDPAPRRSELAAVPPGRYPLDAWVFLGASDGAATMLTRAEGVAAGLRSIVGGPADLEDRLRSLGQLFEQARAVRAAAPDVDSFVRAIRPHLDGQRP